jgi:3-oxoacyl-[acyl-carrier protein] reductase
LRPPTCLGGIERKSGKRVDLQLKNRNAVILGGTRGIGRAIAELLADEGCNVALCARKAAEVEEAGRSLWARGVQAVSEAVDIADAEALKRFVAGAGERLGGVDILISNASALSQGVGEEDWKAMIDVDLMGAVRSFEAAQPLLERAAETNGDASFVMISSVSAAEVSRASAYGPIKAALIHYAKGLARQLAPKKVRVNVVSPGTILFDGGVWDRNRSEAPDMFKWAMERNPMGRMGSPEEIAAAAVFLASPRSSFTTGVNLVVDGAITARVNF